jgi:ankyrin repeat protein
MIYADDKLAFNPVQKVLSKVSSHSKPIMVPEHPLQDKLGLTTMARILRNMVAENDEEGARGVIAQMQLHEKSEGFTIQDVAGNGLLQIAALSDFDSMTELLLEEGFDINYVDDNHVTALQAAMYMDSYKVLEILLDEKRSTQANVNAVGGYYGCALQVAAFRGSRDYINRLVDRGVDKDVLIAKSKYGTALQAAARTGLPFILRQILALKSVNVNAEGGDWGTALQGAAKGEYTTATTYLRRLSRGHVLRQATKVPRKVTEEKTQYPEVAKILLKKGAKVNVRQCGRLKSPLNAAASSGNLEMLKLLLENDDSSGEDKKEVYGRALLSAITQTFNKNRVALVIELTAQGADVGFVAGNCLLNGPLAAAAAMNDEEVVKYLLEISKDNKKEIMDAESGIYGSALRAALLAPKPARDTALYLIRQGADLSDGSGKYGNILHLAAFANLHDIVEVLLNDYKVNVNVDALDSNKQTALHIAAYRGYEHVVSSLLNEGATVNMEDVWGDTPLDVAEDVMGKETHPVPSLQGLRKIREMLLQKATDKREKPASSPFPGPLITKQPQESQSRTKRVRPVFESPKWNPGLNFRASIVDFLEKNEQEYVLIKDLPIDDLLYKEGGIAEAMKEKGADYTLKLRWIHLPANNVRSNLHPV